MAYTERDGKEEKEENGPEWERAEGKTRLQVTELKMLSDQEERYQCHESDGSNQLHPESPIELLKT